MNVLYYPAIFPQNRDPSPWFLSIYPNTSKPPFGSYSGFKTDML